MSDEVDYAATVQLVIRLRATDMSDAQEKVSHWLDPVRGDDVTVTDVDISRFSAADDPELVLSPEDAARVYRSLDNGVFLRYREPMTDLNDIDKVIWRPGLPNELARVILKHCSRSMELELDGHAFRVEPAAGSHDT
jgi:hypothetical protein